MLVSIQPTNLQESCAKVSEVVIDCQGVVTPSE